MILMFQMKDSESATLETVQCIQATTTAVHKVGQVVFSDSIPNEVKCFKSNTAKVSQVGKAVLLKTNHAWK